MNMVIPIHRRPPPPSTSPTFFSHDDSGKTLIDSR
jgi:hypothetical protein